MNPFFPEQASTIAPEVDLIYLVLIALSGLITLVIAVLILVFIIRYRHTSDANRAGASTGNWKVETTWTVIPLFLSLLVFGWAAAVYFDIETPPEGNALEIYAVGKQWMWKFQHANGAREINTLHVPAGRAVRLTMTSQDVIHSVYAPAFRVKQDVLPGRYTHLWFEATIPGTYHLFCAEFCGTDHSRMRGSIVVMAPDEYGEWLLLGSTGGSTTSPGTGRFGRAPTFEQNERLDAQPYDALEATAPAVDMAAAGEALFEELRCVTCHRTDSTLLYPGNGPALEDVFGRPVRLANMRTIIADERYIRESILNPQAKLVLGYPPIMPTYQGQISEMELMQLVAYVKSLSGNNDEPAPNDTTLADTTALTNTTVTEN